MMTRVRSESSRDPKDSHPKVALPALTALVSSNARDDQRGALLGGLSTLQELASALAYPSVETAVSIEDSTFGV